MTVDTRHQARIELDCEAHIFYRQRCFRARAANFSCDGMYLRTHALTLPTGTLIEIELPLADQYRRIAGLVVRQGERGIGVLFRTPQQEIYRLLQAGTPAAKVTYPPISSAPLGRMETATPQLESTL
jgi:hypothetical protein